MSSFWHIHHSASGLSRERRKEKDQEYCGSAAQCLTPMTLSIISLPPEPSLAPYCLCRKSQISSSSDGSILSAFLGHLPCAQPCSVGEAGEGGEVPLLSENFLGINRDRSSSRRGISALKRGRRSLVLDWWEQTARAVRDKRGRSRCTGLAGQGMLPGGGGLHLRLGKWETCG